MEAAATLGGYLDRCITHALAVLEPYPGGDFPPAERDCEVHLFRQQWPNTACGWPGIAGQAFTSAYTIVVVGPCDDAMVYLGRPAYYLPVLAEQEPAAHEAFYKALYSRQMPPVRECNRVGCGPFPVGRI